MRISDWSSDVCSSDLRSPAESRGDVQAGGGHGNGTRRMIAAGTLTVPITRSLARHFHGGSFRPPAPARTHGKAAILDTVGRALGALKEERVRNIARGLSKAAATTAPDLGWGHDRRLSVLDAIMVNATFAHVLEMDEDRKSTRQNSSH